MPHSSPDKVFSNIVVVAANGDRPYPISTSVLMLLLRKSPS
jgi:hypothetical protein